MLSTESLEALLIIDGYFMSINYGLTWQAINHFSTYLGVVTTYVKVSMTSRRPVCTRSTFLSQLITVEARHGIVRKHASTTTDVTFRNLVSKVFVESSQFQKNYFPTKNSFVFVFRLINNNCTMASATEFCAWTLYEYHASVCSATTAHGRVPFRRPFTLILFYTCVLKDLWKKC